MSAPPLSPAAAGPAGGAASDPPAPPDHRALIAVLLAVALATLDTALANVALPTIAADLQAAPAASIWVVNAYQLAVVAVLLPCAAAGDRWGPRRVFLGGLLVFTAASALCALAGSLPALAATRVLQGIGAGAVMSVNIALIRFIVPAARLGRGVGLNALVVGVSFSVGPTLASVVLSVAAWPWLFALNVPLGLFALAYAWPALPRRPTRGPGFERLAALLSALAFAALVLALGSAAQFSPWPLVLGALAVAVFSGAALLRRQAGHPAPMLPLDLLRRPMFLLSALTAFCAFAAQGLAFVALPFFFERALGRAAVDTGFLMTPWPVVVALAAPLAGRLSDRHPPALMGGGGLALLAAGLASLATLTPTASVGDIALRMALCGAGFGAFQSPNLRALMAAAPAERSGSASGTIALVRLLGQTAGAAGVALCFRLAGAQGPAWALALGAGFAAAAALASSARMWAR